jgi:membrane-associated phospholipid phosphatase
MPSLHVGAHWLFMLWIRREIRPLFVLAAVATFLTFIGSIITGWHYAVDGYVGIALAQLVYMVAVRLEKPSSAEEAAPAQDREEA